MTSMEADGFNLADAIAVLERTPATLRALLAGLPETWVHATEGEGTWSPYDVIGHLIHGERTDWIPRARHILAGETQAFESFDRMAQFTESQGKNLDELLATLADLRRENVAALIGMNLSESDLSRRGLHPELGDVTLGQLLATWVVHDLDHLAQVARTMAKVYGETTGPWSEYLSILRDRRGLSERRGLFDSDIHMTKPEISRVSPFFIVRDGAAALSFYRDQLGFEITFQEPADDPFFGTVCRGGAMIMLKDVGVDPLPNYKREPAARWDAYFDVPDPDALAAEFAARNVEFSEPLKDTHDGLRGFELKDCDGYVLFFGRPRS